MIENSMLNKYFLSSLEPGAKTMAVRIPKLYGSVQ